ncbi:MAG: MBL fold metallo-hydrolase [Clostridiales bacterium]|nr:MBL fold metallo-hydrolase [Clostridiales bacterium]
MSLTIHTIPCGSYQANAFLVFMQDRDDCILVDPGDDLQALKDAVARSGKKLSAILLTHGHFDHILAASPLAKETGAQVYVHEGDMEMLNDIRLNAYMPGAAVLPAPKDIIAEEYDDVLDVAGMHFEIVHTPGHSKGSVCLYLREEKKMFTGDTLFQAGFGRMDLHGGSPMQMRTSLKNLFEMDADIAVYPGHGGFSTIGAERARYRL